MPETMQIRRAARAFTVAALGVLGSCRPSVSGNDVPFDPTAAVDAWLEAWNARDLHRIDRLFVDDAGVSYFSSEREGVIRGWAAVREHHVNMGFVEGGVVPQEELWVEQLTSDTYGDAAVVTAIWMFGDRSAPRDSVQRGPMTAVYARVGGEYRLAHMHFAEYP